MAISNSERGIIVSLFNRGGHVLNFTKNDFDNFTMASIGIPLCEHYKKSKGSSLSTYIYHCSNDDALKLLNDLMEYYELNYEDEFTEGDKDPFGQNWHGGYSENYANLYRKARGILDRENGADSPFAKSADYLSKQFDSDYLRDQINLLMEMRKTSPVDAIGKSKDLVESCCKTILKEAGEEVVSNSKMGELIKKTEKVLHIDAGNMPDEQPGAKPAKQIIGSLTGLVSGIAQFRNDWGTGHGRAADFEPLSERHAKLAVGCSITLTEYLWDTYLWRKKTGRLC